MNPLPSPGLVAVVLMVLVPAVASADIVPEDYVETCTLEAIARERSGCVACRTSFQSPDACATQHASDGLEQACRSGGASVWTEVWCSPAAASDPAPAPSDPVPAPDPAPATDPAPAPSPAPAAASSSTCSVTHGGSPATLSLLALLALLTATRRSRRSRG